MEVNQNKKPVETPNQLTERNFIQFEYRGYNQDLIPKGSEKRTMNTANFFTLWMGSIHNIPNYTAVGGFVFLGLSPINIMIALVLSSFVVAGLLIINGRVGSEYGIPFSMHLRATYGNLGAKFPGFLRGCVAAIAWFGFQNYTASLALLILIGKIWPNFLILGGDFQFFGIGLPGLITFTLFWAINVAIGYGGGNALNKFTAILNPLIYIVFIGMAIWAINVSGGLSAILNFVPAGNVNTNQPTLLLFLIVINSVLAVWAAPVASVSDFTQNAKTTKSQEIGQTASLVIGYLIFAFSSISILIGGSIHYGIQEWNVLNIVDKWDNLPAIILSITVLLMTTISTNATGNIIPAGYQLSAMFPKRISYKKGVLIAGAISFIIMPWKLMENSNSIFAFLNIIGGLLGPVAGVMLAHYYIILKQKINLNELYIDFSKDNISNPFYGINKEAYLATILAVVLPLLGQFIRGFEWLVSLSFIVGSCAGFFLYILFKNKKMGGEKDV